MEIVMAQLSELICHRPKYTPQALSLNTLCLYKKVQQSLSRPGQALRILRQSKHEGGKVVRPTQPAAFTS
jgi:hypothetical protein